MIAESLRHRPELIQKKLTREAYENAADAEASLYIWPSFLCRANTQRPSSNMPTAPAAVLHRPVVDTCRLTLPR
jgi:hypothetical protein